MLDVIHTLTCIVCGIVAVFLGKDATGGFYGRNHSDSAKKWMKDFEIGSLGDTSKKWFVCLCVSVILSVCVTCGGLVSLVVVSQHSAKLMLGFMN